MWADAVDPSLRQMKKVAHTPVGPSPWKGALETKRWGLSGNLVALV